MCSYKFFISNTGFITFTIIFIFIAIEQMAVNLYMKKIRNFKIFIYWNFRDHKRKNIDKDSPYPQFAIS